MRTRALVPVPVAVGLTVVVITLGLDLGHDRPLPTARTRQPLPRRRGAQSATPRPIPKEDLVPATFAAKQRLPFQPPVELQSANGQLRTAFSVEPTTFDVAGAKIKGYAFQGQYIGPTLRVRPGDTVRIDLTNKLGQPTNLHGHGMFMSPLGISDNVLRVMKSGTFNHIEWKLPRGHRPWHVLVPHPPARTGREAGLLRPLRCPDRRRAG